MVSSLQAFLHQIVDYAGMFPPAKLSLGESARKYARYRAGREAFLLGRYVCAVAKLQQLEAQLNELGMQFRVCAIGRGGDTPAEFLANTMADVSSLRRFHRTFVDYLEVRLCAQSLSSAELASLILRVKEYMPDEVQLVLEVPFKDDWANAVPSALETIKKTGAAFAKIRTGGIESSAFPTSEQVAVFIDECAANSLPFKATAGMHWPMRHDDAEMGCKMHGFVNVFTAAAIANTLRPNLGTLIEILEEEDASCFKFLEDELRYSTFHVATEQIKEMRSFALSFGSCSIADPVQGLQKLGHRLPLQ